MKRTKTLMGTQESQNSISSNKSQQRQEINKQSMDVINQDNNKRQVQNLKDIRGRQKMEDDNKIVNIHNNNGILVRDDKDVDSDSSDEGYTLRSQSDDDDGNDKEEKCQHQVNPRDQQQCSESGIFLESYIDDEYDMNEDHSINNPSPNQDYESRIQIADQETLIDFTPTENSSSLKSSKAKSGNDEKNFNSQQNGMQRQDFSYNDTLSYLEDMVGSTFLDGLTKTPSPTQCLPPKIQCTAGYIKQLMTKSNSKDNNLLIKDQRILQKPKNPNNDVIINKNITTPYGQLKCQKPLSNQLQHLNNKPSAVINNILESQGQRPLKKRNLQSKIIDVNFNKQSMININKFIHTQNTNKCNDNNTRSISIHKSKPQPQSQHQPQHKHQPQSQTQPQPQQPPTHKFLQDQLISKQKPTHNQQKKHKKQKKSYIQKQKLINNHKQVNGWFYPDRGNVMYDRKVRPWVLQGQLTQQEQYYQGLIKKEYITQLERESLESYLIRKSNMFTPPPYMAPFGMVDNTGFAPTSYFDHSSNYPQYYPQQEQQHYLNYQQPPPLTPPHMISNTYTQTASDKLYKNISSFLHSNHSGIMMQNQYQANNSNSSMSTKTMPIRDNNFNSNVNGGGYNNDRSQQHQYQKQQYYVQNDQMRQKNQQRQRPVKRQNYVTTKIQQQSVKQHKVQKYDNVLPPNILQTSKSSPPPQKVVGLIKQMSKPDHKSQVFVIYDVPIVVSNEHINTISADVFLLPYCKAMLIDKCPSKWIKCLQKLTGINILEKLQLMNEKQKKLKGQQIPDGSLNRIRVNQSSSDKLNFNTLYLVKLTTLIDEGSKTPFGQRLLRDVIDKVIQSLISGILNRRSTGKTQTSLLIHGGFFPGIKREDTPRLISYFLSIALANASLEYKRSGAKPKKIIIHVTKQEQYEVYIKQMRKIMLEYRKLQNF